MRFSDGPFFVLHTFAIALIVMQGSFREASGLIHKPKAIKTAPSSTATTAWTFDRRNGNHFLPSSQQFNNRQREQAEKSIRMRMTHGDIGIQKFERKSSSLIQRLLLASILTAVAMFRTKVTTVPLQFLGWFCSDVLYKPYQTSLVNNPLVTKVFTGAFLSLVGDAVAQATANEGEYDKRRALSFAAFDSCYRVFQHHMFPFIIGLGKGNVVKYILPKFLLPAAAAIEQTTLYQFGIVPGLYYPIFFTFTGFIQGLSLSQSASRMKRQFFPCWKRNLMFWIPTQMVLFGLVAEKWQIPFACLMGMLWSVLLSKTVGNSKKS